jgi:hypothetical protein
MTAFWLILAILSLLVALYMIATSGWEVGSVYLIFPVLAGMMYGFRKFMLGRMDKHNQQNK